MNALAVVLKPINYGWAAALTNGRELARFTGPRRNVVRWATRPAGTNAGRDHARRRRSAQARVFMPVRRAKRGLLPKLVPSSVS